MHWGATRDTRTSKSYGEYWPHNRSVSSPFKKFYTEYVEEEVCRSSALISAKRAAPVTSTVLAWEELSDEHALERLLSAVAFDLYARDAWSVLGLGRLGGHKPTMQILTSRRHVALKLLYAVPTRQLSRAACDAIQAHRDKLTHSCSVCCEDLAPSSGRGDS